MAHYGPGVDLASNRNEYQESSWGVKGGLRVRLATLSPSMGQLSRKCWSLDVSQLFGPSRLDTGTALYLLQLYITKTMRHPAEFSTNDTLLSLREAGNIDFKLHLKLRIICSNGIVPRRMG
jgi:hypothetical protein